MMHALMPIVIPTTTASSDILFWGMIGLLVVLFLLATTLWVIGSRRIRQSQMKEAGQQGEVSPRPAYDEQPPVHSLREETLLPR